MGESPSGGSRLFGGLCCNVFLGLFRGFCFDFHTGIDVYKRQQADNRTEQLPEGAFEFYGVWDQDSADSVSLPSRNVQDISAYYGVPIQLMRKRMQLPGYDLGMNASGTFTLDSTVVPELQSLPRGRYFVMFDVVDVFGNWLQTQQALVDWNGKTAVYSGVEVEAETAEQAEEDIAAEPAEKAAAA